MADFASVFQLAGKPTVQLEDPMQAQMKAASLAQAMQQQQLGALQLQKARQDAADQEIFRKAGEGLDFTTPNATQTMLTRAKSMGLSANSAMAFEQHLQTVKKNFQETEKVELDNKIKNWDMLRGGLMSLAEDPNYGSPESQARYQNLAKFAVDKGIAKPEEVPAFPVDKNILRSLGNQFALGTTLAKENSQNWKYQDGKWFNVSAPGGPKAEGGDIIPTIENRFAPAAMKPWRENDVFKTIASKDPRLAADIESALNNDYQFGGNRGIFRDRDVEAGAQAINPNWRRGNYDLKQAALKDPAIDAANATIMHMGDFLDKFGKLSKNTQIKLLNSPINKWTELVNSNSPEAAVLASLTTTARSMGAEYGRALHTGDSVAAQQANEGLFDPSKTKGQIQGVTSAVGSLIQRVVNATENKTRRSDPNSVPLTLLDDAAIANLAKAGIDYTPGGIPRKADPVVVNALKDKMGITNQMMSTHGQSTQAAPRMAPSHGGKPKYADLPPMPKEKFDALPAETRAYFIQNGGRTE